jgi:hypothetical protein
MTWYDFARLYAAVKWKDASAKSRDSIAATLTAVTVALLAERPGRPGDTRCGQPCAGRFVPTMWPAKDRDQPRSSTSVTVALA